MSENYQNSNGEWVHVDAYTRDDGTHVSEYWRRKYVNSKFNNNDIGKLSSGVSANDYLFKPTVEGYTKYLKNQYHKAVDDMVVNGTNKGVADIVGDVFSFFYNTHNANALYKMASPNYNPNSDYIKKNGILYNSTEDLHDEKLEKKIKARLLLENTGMKDCKVFIGDEDSSLSLQLANSPEVINLVKNDIQYIRKLKSFPAVGTDIVFSNPDLYNSIHGGNISEAKFDNEGNLHLVIEDLYNFNEGRTSVRGRIGEKFQKEGSIIPYYIKFNVIIPKSKLDTY